MKYKDNDDKKKDGFLDRMIDDLIWGFPLGNGVGMNLKTGNIIPYPSFDEDDNDWEKDEFSVDDLADFDDDDDDDDHTLNFSLNLESSSTAPEFSPRDAETVEERYYDPQRKVYCVGRAIRDNFKEIAESFSAEEMRGINLNQSIGVIFSSNQKLALDAVEWAVRNFPKSLEGATCEGLCCGLPSGSFLFGFTYTEHGEDRSFVYDYLESHPEFTKAVVGRQPFSLPGWPTRLYLPYLAEKGDAEKFAEIFKMHVSNPNLDPVECSKFKLIDDFFLRTKNCYEHLDHRIYSFLKSEIEAIPEKLKIDYLLGQLDYESYGVPLFDKPPILGKENYFVQIEQARKRIKEIEEEKDRLYDRINELDEECDKQEELLKEIERQYAGEDDI